MTGTFLVAALALAGPDREIQHSPENAIVQPNPEAAVAAYLEGRDSRSLRLLRSAFHAAAPLQWVDEKGEPRALTQIEWWPKVAASQLPRPAVTDSILDREGDLALAEASSVWPTHAFDDLLILSNSPDGWRIVGKVFRRRDPAGSLPPGSPDDDAAIAQVLRQKTDAQLNWDPALLLASHLPGCLYFHRWTPERDFGYTSLSEGAARYAAHRDRGEIDRETRWRQVKVARRGEIAAAKLEVDYQGKRYIDYLLLMKTSAGWRIAAVVWGDPSRKG